MNCQFICIKDIWDKKINLIIPDIQRGLVWNAAQIEVFWDSLMRDIPIGLFSVVKSAGENILLDGQQRWNALNAAMPNDYGVLWCAIFTDPSKINLYNRKYLFRWTTSNHPWGFKWSENEKSAPRLSIEERRTILKRNGRANAELFIKPQVGEIFPYPYEDDVKMVKVQSLLEDHTPPENFNETEKAYWQKLHGKITEIINQPIIALTGNTQPIDTENSNEQTARQEPDSEWTETFFLRMNSQGTPFDKNELAYSALKSSLHSIGIESPRLIFEETAKILQINRTADVAQIMLQILTHLLYQKNLSSSWDAGTVKNFFKDKACDCNNINENLLLIKKAAKNLKNVIDNFNKRQNRLAVLPYHLTLMPHEIIRLALVLFMLKSDVEHPEELLGLMFALWWFHVEDRINGVRNPLFAATEFIITKCKKEEFFDWQELFAQCVYNEWIILPHSPDTLKKAAKENKISEILYELRKGKTFDWESSKNFVLLACGKYLMNNFSNTAYLNEDNRPWDYDHLFPKTKATETTSKMCGSAGNNVPIALTTNREKQAAYPNRNYPDDKQESQYLLYLDPDKFENLDIPDNFNKFAAERYWEMYSDVYEAFHWDDFAGYYISENDFAKKAGEITRTVFERTSRECSWYYVMDGRDFPVLNDSDYLRFKFFVLRSSEEKCFAFETVDFKTFSSYGKRKDAADPIRKGVYWWDDSDLKEGMTDNEAIDWFIAKTGTK
ncbi:MAG: DUF262 domain-containing protein [Lentisphaeria bacterium]|nr:DUF262 domain-containing protein [Lentisphaeria bacterium]